MFRKWLVLIAAFIMALCIVPSSFALAAGPTISIKLENYVGNQHSVVINAKGNYSDNVTNDRLGGADRFQVAVNVANKGWDQSRIVFLTNYLAFADALAATPYAYKLQAPILLTKSDTLTETTKNEITKLHASKAIIIGGTGSVSDQVVSQLKGMGLTVDRIGGSDRYQVAENIAGQMGGFSKAIVANGLKFPDSLSIAPYAARHGYPILLTRADSVPSYTKQALQNHPSIVVGGDASVSPSVYSQVNGDLRIGGSDRYEVAANVIRDLGLNPDHAFVATGEKFADALTGSVLAAKEDVPILLTRPDSLPSYTSSVIKEKNINVFTVLGGTASVSDNVQNSQLPSMISIQNGPNYEVKQNNGGLALYKGNQLVYQFSGPFTLNPSAVSGNNTLTIAGHQYIGKMEFTQDGSYVRPINQNIPFEDYLKSVVPSEMPASWGSSGGMSALKAQAIAARTYAYDMRGQTITDTQGAQVYGGYDWYTNSSQAVQDTYGQVLTYNGSLISAVYSSSNGGYTESNTNAWGSSPVPYLPAKPDSYDPKFPWSVTINKTQIDTSKLDMKNPGHWWWSVSEQDQGVCNLLKDWLYNNGYKNRDIKITKIYSFSNLVKYSTGARTKTGQFKFDFVLYPESSSDYNSNGDLKIHTATATVDTTSLRSAIGGMNFKSRYITSVNNNSVDSNGQSVIQINGLGFGHGVGMSQWGAYERAKAGQSYQTILGFYYPGTKLTKEY